MGRVTSDLSPEIRWAEKKEDTIFGHQLKSPTTDQCNNGTEQIWKNNLSYPSVFFVSVPVCSCVCVLLWLMQEPHLAQDYAHVLSLTESSEVYCYIGSITIKMLSQL